MDRRTKRPGLLCYADNYRNDVRFGVIVDVEASAVGQAEVGAARTILEVPKSVFVSNRSGWLPIPPMDRLRC
jgi:hypothetical protein